MMMLYVRAAVRASIERTVFHSSQQGGGEVKIEVARKCLEASYQNPQNPFLEGTTAAGQ
jgi:hypothetical protein